LLVFRLCTALPLYPKVRPSCCQNLRENDSNCGTQILLDPSSLLLIFILFTMNTSEFKTINRATSPSIFNNTFALSELDSNAIETISQNITTSYFQLCHGYLVLDDDSKITWNSFLEMEEPEFYSQDKLHIYPLSYSKGNYILPTAISGIKAKFSLNDGKLHIHYGELGTIEYLYQIGLGLILSSQKRGCQEILDSIISHYETHGANIEFTFCEDEEDEDELWG